LVWRKSKKCKQKGSKCTCSSNKQGNENVQKALEEKMERVISKDDDWDVIIQKTAKTMKEVCGISRHRRKETWWWNGNVKKGLREKK